MRNHQRIDALNLELDRAIAAKLRREPGLFTRVRANLHRWRTELDPIGGGSLRYLEAWEALAAKGLEPCIAKALEHSESATAMRQAGPFAGILTQAERRAIIREFNRTYEASAA